MPAMGPSMVYSENECVYVLEAGPQKRREAGGEEPPAKMPRAMHPGEEGENWGPHSNYADGTSADASSSSAPAPPPLVGPGSEQDPIVL